MRAVIVSEVDLAYGDVDVLAEQPNNVPIMQLEDGTRVPAYFCDRFIRLGTEGEAEFDVYRRVWRFIPDA